MAKLVLQFEDRLLKECVVGRQGVKIGRLPDNTVMIDNPAVSSHHARVYRDGDDCILEDLHSTNGTFVNGTRVTRQTLQHGDLVLIGKHTLLFDHAAGEQSLMAEVGPMPAIPELGGTLFLDTRQHRELLATITDANKAATMAPTTRSPNNVGVLRVLAGRTEQSEYCLNAYSSLIGKADAALVRLRGWFKPKVAMVIARRREGYVATPCAERT